MQAIVFDRLGLPTEVLELREIEKPTPARGQVLVKMVNAPINKGDFLFIQNLYPDPKKPALPGQVAGNYGTGIIVEKGPGASIAEGTLVPEVPPEKGFLSSVKKFYEQKNIIEEHRTTGGGWIRAAGIDPADITAK